MYLTEIKAFNPFNFNLIIGIYNNLMNFPQNQLTFHNQLIDKLSEGISLKDEELDYLMALLITQETFSFRIIFGYDLDKVNNNGKTPLQVSCSINCPEFVLLFLEQGANPNISNNAPSPLMISIFKGNPLITSMLLKYGANVNELYKSVSSEGEVMQLSVIDLAFRLDTHGPKVMKMILDKNPTIYLPIAMPEGIKNKDLLLSLELFTSYIKKEGVKCVNKAEIDDIQLANPPVNLPADTQEQYLSLKQQYISGIFLGTFVINPSIRYIRDQIDGSNKDKYFSEYYSEMFTLSAFSDILTSLLVPITTKFVSYYLGINGGTLSESSYLKIIPSSGSSFLDGVIHAALPELFLCGVESLVGQHH